MGKISMMSTLLALIQAILTEKKTKQRQKEVRNDDQLKPNLITFPSLFVCIMTGNREGVICYSGCFCYN